MISWKDEKKPVPWAADEYLSQEYYGIYKTTY
jgi:hypothetical protein